MPCYLCCILTPSAWYTDNTPSNDAQVAAHFSSKRPILGLCLKRYTFKNGQPARLGTYIDIPVEIGLPNFVQDSGVSDGQAVFGNFKLSLQSVVCHRGNSVNSGHYIALVRGTTPSSNTDSAEDATHWMRFDDLAHQRVTMVNIYQALREETPYLLFYQILPMEDDTGLKSDTETSEPRGGLSATSLPLSRVSTTGPTSGRPSFEITAPDNLRGRSPVEGRRPSAVSFSEESATGLLAAASSPGKGHSRSGSSGASHQRSLSKNSESGGGLGRTLSKLTKRKSRDKSGDRKPEAPAPHNVGSSEVHVREVTDLTPSATEVAAPPKPNTLTVNPTPAHSGSSRHKRESSKHKSRLSKHEGKSKNGLDRECTVM